MARPPLPVGTAGKTTFYTMLNGRIRARTRVRDYDGATRILERFGRTKPAAERNLKEALRDRIASAGGTISAASRFREVAAMWVEEMQAQDLSDGSKEVYARTLKNHVTPALGELLMREVDVPAVDRFFKAVREHDGVAAAKSAKSVTSLVLGLAVRHGAIPQNPVRDASKITRPTRKEAPRALTPADAIALVKLFDEGDMRDVAVFMLGTGLRIGEALAIRQSAVDLEAGVIEVNATIVRLTGQGAVLQERTKTEAGWRILAVPASVVELLQRRMALPANEHGLIFPSVKGLPQNPSNKWREMRDVLTEDSGFGWVTSHTFRKTVATRLDEAGLSARAIADHLGHAKPSMTQDVYMGRGVASAAAAEILGRAA